MIPTSCDPSSPAFDLYRHVWFIGIIATIIASIGGTMGIILQKMAHNENDALPLADRARVSYGLMISKRWMVGFFLLAIFPILFEAIAYTFAPQSLISPLGGMTIILNQLVAPPLLGEIVTRADWYAILVLFIGILFCALFGLHLQPDINETNLSDYYSAPAFQITEILLLFLIFIAMGAVHYAFKNRWHDNTRMVPFADAWIAAAFGAQQNVAFKAFGMIIYSSLAKSEHPFTDWQIYVLFLLVMVLAVLQLVYLNKGLAKHDAVLFLPLYSGLLIICSTLLGGIFYQEFHCFHKTGLSLFFIGIGIVVLGMILLTRRQEVDEDKEGSGPLLGNGLRRDAPVFRREESEEPTSPTGRTSSFAHRFFSMSSFIPTLLKPSQSHAATV